MHAATSHSSASAISRLIKSKWWFVLSFLVPALVAFSGAVWLAYRLGEYRSETERLVTEAAAAEERRAQAEAKVAELTSRVAELDAKRTNAEADVATLNAKVADLQFQEAALTTSLSTPDAAATISRVRAESANARERAYALVREGERAANRRHVDVAKTLYEAAIREDGRYAPPWIALGFMAVGRGDMAEAERMYLAARDADPNDPYALTALVNLYMGQKQRIADAQKLAAVLRTMRDLPPAAEIALSKVPSK